MQKRTKPRQLHLDALEPRLMLTWDLASDFTGDFVGNLPQNNPNGPWSYLAQDGTTTSLVATDGSSPNTGGVGAGWADATGIPNYARAATSPPFNFPSGTMSGHGPNKILWTAPPTATMGGVEITGLLTQFLLEPERQMRLEIRKNDFAPIVAVNADFDVQNTIVPIPATQVAIAPGDVLSISISGNGPEGNGVSTFASFNVHLEPFDPEIDADFDGDFAVGDSDYAIWAANVGMPSGATKAHGDADDDGDVDGDDFLIWQRQYGNAIDSGVGDSDYHPTAVIIETTGVTLPDGSSLNIAGTQTQGFQEAFDYAADEGWDVFALPGTYSLNAGVSLQALQGKAFRFKDVTLNFSPSVTNYGLRFDSTMITDFYWSGGALNAPDAQHGVLFDPENLHPLDGIILDTRGVVDSRFNFKVPITAINPVTMDTIKDQSPFVGVTINDVNFHFDGIAPNQINYVGTGFVSNNTFMDDRSDDPIPWNLFDTAGRVTVLTPDGVIGSVAGLVYAPDGTLISTAGTTTSGLQEAFDYAGQNDLDVLVFGRGIRAVAPMSNLGLYRLNSTLTVGDLTNRTYRIFSVTFDYTGNSTIMSFGNLDGADFELTGQIVGGNSTIGADFAPDNLITDSIVRLQHVVFSDKNVSFDTSAGTIEQSEFYFHELNIGDVGIEITSPATGEFFRNNVVRTNHTHAMTDTGVQIGTTDVNTNNIRLNDFILRTSTDNGQAAANVGVSVRGLFNDIDYIVIEAGQAIGVRFEAASSNNALTHGTISAAQPIIDLGTGNTCNGGSCPGSIQGPEAPLATSVSRREGEKLKDPSPRVTPEAVSAEIARSPEGHTAGSQRQPVVHANAQSMRSVDNVPKDREVEPRDQFFAELAGFMAACPRHISR